MSLDATALLPGIHASLCGMLFAFYTAYIFYVYQKISDIENELDFQIASIGNCNFITVDVDTELSVENYNKYTDEIKMRFFALGNSADYDYDQLKAQQVEIEKILNIFMSLISQFQEKYKFVPNIDDFNTTLYKKSYSDIEKVYGVFNYYYDIFIKKLIQNYEMNSQLLKLKILEKVYKELDMQFGSSGFEIPHETYKQMVKSGYDSYINMIVIREKSFENIIQNINNCFNFFKIEFIEIKKTIKKLDRVKEVHNLYKKSEMVFAFLAFILVLGIISPLVIIAKKDCLVGTFIISWQFELLLMLLTFLPYVAVGFFSLKELKEKL